MRGTSGRNMNEVTSVMFVPKTPEGKLISLLEAAADGIREQMDWSIKFVEKPGSPLLSKFIKRFPMERGCYRGEKCVLCNNKRTVHTVKGIV